MKIVLCFFLALFYFVYSSFPLYASTYTNQMIINSENNWIRSMVLTDGSIKLYPRSTVPYAHVSPYFSNLMAMTVVQANPYGLFLAKSNMQWYFNHLNEPDKFGYSGTVYDYHSGKHAVTTPLYNYDSADSYSGTFISLVLQYDENSGDEKFLIENRNYIEQIANVMIKLMDKDNLAFAKSTWNVKYLMDNCEMYRGLMDMSILERTVYHNLDKSYYYQSKASLVQTAILTTLRNGNEFFPYIAGSSEKGTPTKWNIFYPDSVSQLFPIIYGVISPDSLLAKQVYAKFNRYYPNWTKMWIRDSHPWACIGYTAAVMNDHERVSEFSSYLESNYLYQGHSYPWDGVQTSWVIRMLERDNKNQSLVTYFYPFHSSLLVFWN